MQSRFWRDCLVVLMAIMCMGCDPEGGYEIVDGNGNTAGRNDKPDFAFAQTVYPIVRNFCAQCHDAGGIGPPNFADVDQIAAYNAMVNNNKVDLVNPANSRLVIRLLDQHFCWSNPTDCDADAETVRLAIVDWAQLEANNAAAADF